MLLCFLLQYTLICSKQMCHIIIAVERSENWQPQLNVQMKYNEFANIRGPQLQLPRKLGLLQVPSTEYRAQLVEPFRTSGR